MLRKLDYLWRLFGTGIGFTFFGVGGFLLSVTVFPIVAITAPDEDSRKFRTQNLIHGCFRMLVRLLTILKVLELDSRGVEKLQDCQGKIIIANHPSLLDVVMLMSLLPKGQCVVKHQLWDNWFLGGVVRAAGYIRNDEDASKMIDRCVGVLQQGENIILFPEGTRTVPGQPLKFQRGFANIATFARANLHTVTITCVPTTLTKGQPWYQIPDKRMKFTLISHDEIEVEDYLSANNRTVAARKLTRDLEQYYVGKLSYGQT